MNTEGLERELRQQALDANSTYEAKLVLRAADTIASLRADLAEAVAVHLPNALRIACRNEAGWELDAARNFVSKHRGKTDANG